MEAIRAIALIQGKCPNLSYTICGYEREKGYLKQMQDEIKKNDLEGIITIKSFIEYENLHSELEDYHVFIHASRYGNGKNCEGGAPIILLEAQATGMPVISTTHCDIPNEVIHNETGLLCEEKNIIELSKLIETFYLMEQLEYNSMQDRARQNIENRFNILQNAESLYQVYKEVVDGE